MVGARPLDVVTVEGPEAEKYLQGQLSQNVASMGVGDCRHSLLLQPQGHVVAWFRVVRTDDEKFELIVEAGGGEAVAARLERFKLGTKAEVSVRSERALATRYESAEDRPLEVVRDGQLAEVPALWPSVHGFDSFGETEIGGDDELLEVLRIAAGVPAFGRDYDEKTVPAELGIVDMSADFTKGCYTGQELVARMDSRGNNAPRQLRVLAGPGDAPARGTEVHHDDASVGTVTSTAPSDGGWVALASIKRSALDHAELKVAGSAAAVRNPHASPESQSPS